MRSAKYPLGPLGRGQRPWRVPCSPRRLPHPASPNLTLQVGAVKTYTFVHMNPTYERLDVPASCQEPYNPGLQKVHDMAAEAINLLHAIQVHDSSTYV